MFRQMRNPNHRIGLSYICGQPGYGVLVRKFIALTTLIAFGMGSANGIIGVEYGRHQHFQINGSASPPAKTKNNHAHLATGGSQNRELRPNSLNSRPQMLNLQSSATSSPSVGNDALTLSPSKLPLSFERNQGQEGPRARFVSHAKSYTLSLRDDGPELLLVKRIPNSNSEHGDKDAIAAYSHSVRLSLIGANPHPSMTPVDELPGKVNYFVGHDSSKWLSNIPTFKRVVAHSVYPGIDIAYYGTQGKMEFDFLVAPGANTTIIEFNVVGADKLTIAQNGDLILQLPSGEIREQLPKVYQEVNGTKHAISGSYVLRGRTRVGFKLAEYDHNHKLVIDPVLLYSTYLGGGNSDFPTGIAVDPLGNAYVTGYTFSIDFPVVGGIQQSCPGTITCTSVLAFISKLNASGDAFLYSSYFGGSSGAATTPSAVAVDANGNAYVTGGTHAPDFPTTSTAFQSVLLGSFGVFLLKLNPTGSSILYSTLLGGEASRGAAIVVDSGGNAYIAGSTSQPDFPVTQSAFQKSFRGGDLGGEGGDGFVAKIDPSQSGAASLVYSTYLGGSAGEFARGISVDSSRNAYVVGDTNSLDFPTTPGVFQQSSRHSTCDRTSCRDVFIAKLNQSGSALVYSTYLGGTAPSAASGIAVDTAGSAYVTGHTLSLDFPVKNAAQSTCRNPNPSSCDNAFVTKLNPTASALDYSTYLGGSGLSRPAGVGVDSAGDAYVAGTASADFPVVGQTFTTDCTPVCQANAFVTKIDPAGSSFAYSTLVGGQDIDEAVSIAVSPAGNAYVAGTTQSLDFPISRTAAQLTFGGVSDAFVIKLSASPVSREVNLLAIQPAKGGDIGFVSATVLGSGIQDGATAVLERAGQVIVGSSPTVDPSGQALSARYDLRGQVQGSWDVVVTNPDGATAKLIGGFAVEPGVSPELWVDIVGNNANPLVSSTAPQVVGPARLLIVGNRGNVDAIGVPVWLSVPNGAPVKIENLALPPGGDPQQLTDVPISVDTVSDRRIPLFIPRVPAYGIAVPIVFRINLDHLGAYELRAWANPPYFDPSGQLVGSTASGFTKVAKFALQDGAVPGQAISPVLQCLISCVSLVVPIPDLKGAEECAQGIVASTLDLLNVAVSAANEPISLVQIVDVGTKRALAFGGCFGVVGGTLLKRVVIAWSLYDTVVDCGIATGKFAPTAQHLGPFLYHLLVVASGDPNGKFGSQGSGSRRYISGSQTLRYNVFFSNEPTATAPAQKVVITDQLDLAVVDLSTFIFGPIVFGSNKVIVPPVGVRDFSDTVDLRPARDLLVRVHAVLDQSTGLVTWTFSSLDPSTNLPPPNPLVGFLPPDVNSPEGEGGVFFFVGPKQTLATDTQVTNQAKIIFDTNSPVDTLDWLNTLDNSNPASHVMPLPATEKASDFVVQWAGTDNGSGIQAVSVYVSDNAGPFTAWQLDSSAQSATFQGQFDHSYSFYSIARDFAGNLEPAKSTAEATTRVQANSPPVANAGPNQTIECANHTGTPVTLDASASIDLDGDSLTYTWKNSSGTVVGTSATIPQVLPLGTYTYSLEVKDSVGMISNSTTTVKVRDTSPPVVISSLAVSEFSPNNHNLANVGLAVSTTDTCGTSPTVTVWVFGNEDDQTPTDNQGTVFSPDAKGIAPSTLRLRAERSDSGQGRVYLVVVKAIDASGNFSLSANAVVIPKSSSATSIKTVNSLAMAAKIFALNPTNKNNPKPPGYFVIGEGPVIGPKQ